MKYAYFSIPLIGANILPDDPGKIFNLAMRYKRDKEKGDAFRELIRGKQRLSVMQRINNTINDLGAASGLGITMLGAKLNQYEPTRGLGTALKKHGINTLTSPELKNLYGIGVPTVLLGGAGLAAKKGYDAVTGDYD